MLSPMKTIVLIVMYLLKFPRRRTDNGSLGCVRRVLLLLAVCAGLGGCAQQVHGDALAGARAPAASTRSSTPKVDPNSREAQWMNGFCGVGKLLVTAAETQPKPQVSSDPTVLKQEFSETVGRLVNVLDAALTDLKRLPTAPVGGLDDVVSTVSGHLTDARNAINHAKSTVDAAAELTPEVYGAAVDEFGRGVTSLQQATDFLKVVDLPDVMDRAATAAPNCSGDNGFPIGTR
jgi:hypothetical protein